MTEDLYIVAIAALLPLTACMLVFQTNPYHALVIRGILGAVAALVYALFGAVDVALTEALVGTMLSITLYAVAVRSSLSMRLGILETAPTFPTDDSESQRSFAQLRSAISQALNKYHMRLELVSYPNLQALQTALLEKEVHTICLQAEQWTTEEPSQLIPTEPLPHYYLQTRVQRLYTLMQTAEIPLHLASLSYKPASLSQTNAYQSSTGIPDPVEV